MQLGLVTQPGLVMQSARQCNCLGDATGAGKATGMATQPGLALHLGLATQPGSVAQLGLAMQLKQQCNQGW